MTIPMPEQKPSARLTGGRFPGYDVLSKRLTPSWNEKTREVVTRRLALDPEPKFFTSDEFRTVRAIADRIVPQPTTRPPIPVAGLVDDKLHRHNEDGFREADMPREGEAWRRGLRALDDDAKQAFGARFSDLSAPNMDELLARMEKGLLKGAAWGGMPSGTFFKMRMARDIVHAYYAHPTAWSEVGWGGPASPRGYVRMDFNDRDPWEAAEVKDGDAASARRKNRRVG
jgi:Gluconate 2-dehydrogenase subunit 3